MHGVLDVGRVVFQAEDEKLFFVKDGEPVQEVHGIQTHLEPHLEPKEEAQALREGPSPSLSPQCSGTGMSRRRVIQVNSCLQRTDFEPRALLGPHAGF